MILVGVATWNAFQDPAPPALDKVRQVPSTIESVYWEQTVIVYERTASGWQALKPFIAKGDHTAPPTLPAEIPARYLTDTRNFQVEVIPYYSVLLSQPGAAPLEQAVSKDEFSNWRPGDRVLLFFRNSLEDLQRVAK